MTIPRTPRTRRTTPAAVGGFGWMGLGTACAI